MDNRNTQTLKCNRNFKVTMHRNLVKATFDQTLTCQEQRILYTVISNLPAPEFLKDDKGNFILDKHGNKQITNYLNEAPLYEMSIKEFGELTGVKEVSYRTLKKICANFMKKLIDVRDVNATSREEEDFDHTQWIIRCEDFDYIQWIIRCQYVGSQGIIKIQLSPNLLPFVANLTSNFVSVSLGTLMDFKCKYSARLYFLLQQWRKVKTKQFDLVNLKEMLGVPVVGIEEVDGKEVKIFKLERYTHFKQRVLEPALKEINEFSDMVVEFKEIKKGRKTNSIEFSIFDKPMQAKEEKQPTEPSTYEQLIRNASFGDFNIEFYKNAAKALEEMQDVENKQRLVTYHLGTLKTYLQKRSDEINSPAGFIISQIQKAVERYNSSGEFDFKELLESGGIRVERMPSWALEDEKPPSKTPEEQAEFERKVAELQASLKERKRV
ncbi:replication initiation protein [Bacillus sp. 37MA]|nr:replication initiation protein [Bacillus sp. 37MA]